MHYWLLLLTNQWCALTNLLWNSSASPAAVSAGCKICLIFLVVAFDSNRESDIWIQLPVLLILLSLTISPWVSITYFFVSRLLSDRQSLADAPVESLEHHFATTHDTPRFETAVSVPQLNLGRSKADPAFKISVFYSLQTTTWTSTRWFWRLPNPSPQPRRRWSRLHRRPNGSSSHPEWSERGRCTRPTMGSGPTDSSPPYVFGTLSFVKSIPYHFFFHRCKTDLRLEWSPQQHTACAKLPIPSSRVMPPKKSSSRLPSRWPARRPNCSSPVKSRPIPTPCPWSDFRWAIFYYPSSNDNMLADTWRYEMFHRLPETPLRRQRITSSRLPSSPSSRMRNARSSYRRQWLAWSRARSPPVQRYSKRNVNLRKHERSSRPSGVQSTTTSPRKMGSSPATAQTSSSSSAPSLPSIISTHI